MPFAPEFRRISVARVCDISFRTLCIFPCILPQCVCVGFTELLVVLLRPKLRLRRHRELGAGSGKHKRKFSAAYVRRNDFSDRRKQGRHRKLERQYEITAIKMVWNNENILHFYEVFYVTKYAEYRIDKRVSTTFYKSILLNSITIFEVWICNKIQFSI